MDRGIDSGLAAVESAEADIEAALRDQDWSGVRAGNARLDRALAAFAERLAAIRESGDLQGSMAGPAQRLARVLENYDRLSGLLGAARDRAASELRDARKGRSAASSYLDTASFGG